MLLFIIGLIILVGGFVFLIITENPLFIILVMIGLFLILASKDQAKPKPIEYKQVITTKPTLGKTVSNKDTIIYVTDTTYIQKN